MRILHYPRLGATIFPVACTLLRVWELALTILYYELVNKSYRIEGKYNPFTLEGTLNSQCIF